MPQLTLSQSSHFPLAMLTDDSPDFRLFLGDNSLDSVGGSGAIFGTSGPQAVGIEDFAGTITLDPSFNRGGDLIFLEGKAERWEVVRLGSSAVLSDGDTFVSIPLGTVGTVVAFGDGSRLLRFDEATQTSRLGPQEFGSTSERVTGPADNPPYARSPDLSATSRLFVTSDDPVYAGVGLNGGKLAVFGSNGANNLSFNAGEITLDPSFARGEDQLTLFAPTSTFSVALFGSSVKLDGQFIDMTIPIGAVGQVIHFDNADRVLVFDAASNQVTIGSQIVTSTAAPLG